MSFEAKRLRVQIPCGEPTRVIEAGDDPRPVCIYVATQPPPPCNYGYATPGPCVGGSEPCYLFGTYCVRFQTCYAASGGCGPTGCGPTGCEPSLCAGAASGGCMSLASNFPCFGGLPSLCRIESDFDRCGEGTGCLGSIPILVDADRQIFVAPEHLPLLRGRLEQRMKEIDAYAQGLRDDVESQIAEIDRAEQALRDREADEE